MKYLSNIVRNLKFYLSSQKYEWMEVFTYRTQAISWMFLAGLGTVSVFISISVIYTVSNGLPGWTYFQLLALSAMTEISAGILWYIINPHSIVNSMRNGGIDQLLLKPYSPITVLLTRYGSRYKIGTVISGLVLFVYALSNIKFNMFLLLVYIPIYIAGIAALVFTILAITLASYIKFKSGNYINWGILVAQEAARYPVSIYGIIGIALLSIIMPVAFTSFFPALILFGKVNYIFAGLMILISSILAIIFYTASTHLIKHYESGGG